jgi:hypothetical protein
MVVDLMEKILLGAALAGAALFFAKFAHGQEFATPAAPWQVGTTYQFAQPGQAYQETWDVEQCSDYEASQGTPVAPILPGQQPAIVVEIVPQYTPHDRTLCANAEVPGADGNNGIPPDEAADPAAEEDQTADPESPPDDTSDSGDE